MRRHFWNIGVSCEWPNYVLCRAFWCTLKPKPTKFALWLSSLGYAKAAIPSARTWLLRENPSHVSFQANVFWIISLGLCSFLRQLSVFRSQYTMSNEGAPFIPIKEQIKDVIVRQRWTPSSLCIGICIHGVMVVMYVVVGMIFVNAAMLSCSSNHGTIPSNTY